MKRIEIILVVIFSLIAICAQSTDYPEELNDCDIIYEILDGIYAPRESWTRAAVVRFITGAKDGEYRNMDFNHQDINGDLLYHTISERDIIGNWTSYTRWFAGADSTPQGYTPKDDYAPTSHNPDNDACKAKFDKYMNLDYISYKGFMTENWTNCLYTTSYMGSKLSISATGKHAAGVGGTINVSGEGIYSIQNGDMFLTINVLKYVSYTPKIIKTSEKCYNGTNYLFYFKDFMEKDFSFYTYTIENVQAHPSITVNTAGKNFYVALRDKPISEMTTAKYKLKITSGYGNAEAELSFYLYPSSLVIQSETGGNTDPYPGLIGGEPGDTVTVTCIPDETHEFNGWIGSAVTVENEKQNPITVTLTNEQLTLKPQYTEIPYVERKDLILSFNPKKGTLTVNDNEYTESTSLRLPKGTLIKIQATPKDGYQFSAWDGDMSAAFKTDDYVEFYLNDTKDISAIFEEKPIEQNNSGTSTAFSTIGTNPNKTNENILKLDKSLLDALTKNNSSGNLTRTGATSFIENGNTVNNKNKFPSSSSSYNSFEHNWSVEDGKIVANKSNQTNIREVNQLRNDSTYCFKYKTFEGDRFNAGEGMQIYYSTDEVEQFHSINSTISPSSIMSNLMNIIQGGN